MLRNLKIHDGQRQYPPAVIEDLRANRHILPVQPDVQGQGIVLVAVINGQMELIPLRSRGGQVAAAQGLQENPGRADGRYLVVRHQVELQGHIVKGQGAPLAGYFARNARNGLRGSDGEGCLLYTSPSPRD